jgi:hypothetical protein
MKGSEALLNPEGCGILAEELCKVGLHLGQVRHCVLQAFNLLLRVLDNSTVKRGEIELVHLLLYVVLELLWSWVKVN